MSATDYFEKGPPVSSTESKPDTGADHDAAVGTTIDVTAGSQALHRKLRGKEVQLFAIGGAIGTCKLRPLQLWHEQG